MAYGVWLMEDGKSPSQEKEIEMAFRFEGLEIFHIAVDLSARVHELVKKFPAEERFDLASQARRAANSIVLNIAEGSGRGTKKDFSHFLDMASAQSLKPSHVFSLPKSSPTFLRRTWRKSKERLNPWVRGSTRSRRH
jgi:23S rRNA-intervening sequence protein